MLIKFMKHGTGSGQAASRYLLSDKDHKGIERAEVLVLRGDPELVGKVADSLEFKHRYTSGVIAFSPEDKPTNEQINKVLDDFERVAFAGLDKDRFAFSAILHRENDACHVHVFAARVDLETGKSFNIAPPGWEKTFDPLRDYHNYLNGWSRPDDPALSRTVQPGHGALIEASELRAGLQVEPDAKALITKFLEQRIEKGLITDRAGIVSALQDAGLTVNRQGKDYISVKDDQGEKYRLKGSIYYENFTASGTLKEPDRAREQATREPNKKLARQAFSELEQAIKARTGYNSQRYQSTERSTRRNDERLSKESVSNDASAAMRDTNLVQLSNALYLPMVTSRVIQSDNDRAANGRPADLSIDNQPRLDVVPARQTIPLQTQREATKPQGEQINERIRNAVDDLINKANRAAQRTISAVSQCTKSAMAAVTKLSTAGASAERASNSINKAIPRLRANMDAELERFKSGVNIAEFAQSIGYEIIRRESTKASIVMKSGGDKVIIATDKKDGHGIYFSVHDERDSGSIIDFAQKRLGGNLGQIRKELRGWMPSTKQPSPKRKPEHQRIEKPQPSESNHHRLAIRFEKFKDYSGNYLKSRGLPDDWVKAFNLAQDERGNAVFPHVSADGNLSGWEAKNAEFKGFSEGGSRGLFLTQLDNEQTKKIIVTESGIDAISRAILHHEPGNLYVSTGGSLSEKQIEQIGELLKTNKESKLFISFDNDIKGNEMTEQLSKSLNIKAMRETPPNGHKDWNEQLQSQQQQQQKNQTPRVR